MSYTFSSTEEYIKNMYEAIGVFTPNQLHPERISEHLNISIAYLPVRSWRVDDYIFLDNRLDASEQWQEFGHELCHALWHQDNQYHLTKPYIQYQESQANHFAYYACVPTQMLLEIPLPDDMRSAVHRICTTFNVTPVFAQKRLELYLNKMYQSTS